MTTDAQLPQPNGAVLTTQNATIQTAQVEIHVLKVGTKQVTMGMFRQFPLVSITDVPDLSAYGIPWGLVNYWWEGDGRAGRAKEACLHLIWQSEEDALYRSVVYREVDPDLLERWDTCAVRLMTEIGLLRLCTTASVQHIHFPRPYRDRYRVTIDGMDLVLALDDTTRRVVAAYCQYRDPFSGGGACLAAAGTG